MKSQLKSRQKRPISVGEKSTKEIKQLAVSVAILEIIENEGLPKVTHSKVSRKSKVSRSWIYEYIGKEKNDLVEFGAEVFAGHLARVEIVHLPNTKETLQANLNDGVKFLFDSVESNPQVIKLYFKFRGTQNPVGKVIHKYEVQWIENSSKVLVSVLGLTPEHADLLVETMLMLRLGFAHRMTTSSDIRKSREKAETVFNLIQTMIFGAFSK